MMRLGTSFETQLAPHAAFAYLADFARIEEWDPFIRRAERLDPGPHGSARATAWRADSSAEGWS